MLLLLSVNKSVLITFLKNILCRLACDPSIEISDYYSNIVDSRFYNVCKENGYQLDAALDKILDELVVDEQYLKLVADVPAQEHDDYETKSENLFDYVMAFVGFFMIHNIRPYSYFEIRDEFIELYEVEKSS